MSIVLNVVGIKKMTGINTFIDFFDKFDPVTTFALAFFNLILVFIVFRFTQKMSQSKLSLSPEVDLNNDEIKYKDANLDFETAFEYREDGFPVRKSPLRFNQENLYIRVKNRGELPSTKVKIQMKLKIYKTIITASLISKEGRKFLTGERKLHEIQNIDITIDYMGADEERLYSIVSLYGQVREVELVLTKIRSNGHTYFKGKSYNPTIIYHYTYPYLKNVWGEEDSRESVYGPIGSGEETEKMRKKDERYIKMQNEWYDFKQREYEEEWIEEQKKEKQQEPRFRGEID
ncbi:MULTISPECIES: hypothetical protein [Exiguobacterium]|uniref:hypothetical protein n=1 Tax=Exiguobacterium TaxID=33986 RepID=UPI001BEC353F|nr:MULTISPECIES: hypothetical protein [Exiguobacterium]MCT4776349.1 hypothetical protein [Exiguobacterium aquaticum]MCT4789372.1 hypothetical protein [Exiguobacterium mexicanum]